MDFVNVLPGKILVLVVALLIFLIFVVAFIKLVLWSKKMPKGAYLFLAFFPLISLFPIPPQEIKKLERIKQERINEEDESGKKNRDSKEH
ncbi:hypothetical protein [Planctobacterium marinum]|uniref:Uncharacterized protein n=1 Tax=Planctobacterium marinum TaxID=1631968 RepID=A0AA48HSF7_9ALTE|nr:hypothetical protein MACH26_33930 [Planctobacterium marinum]